MARVTILLDTRSQKKNGTYPLKIRVAHRGEFYIPLQIDLRLDQWAQDRVTGHPLMKRHNLFINARKLEIERQLLALDEQHRLETMSSAVLKQYIAQGDRQEDLTLAGYMERYLQHVHNTNTRNTFINMFAKVEKFCAERQNGL